tara:strand:+ start:441 stop:1151 length:711 start_codon:yes stop_codon:yes gene_type:complete
MIDTPNNEENNTEKSQVLSGEESTEKTDTERVFSKSEVDTLLTKVRKEEKDKLYKSIEKAKSSSESVSMEKEKIEEELDVTKKRLKTIEDDKLSTLDKVSQQIKLLQEQNDLLKKQVQEVAVAADNKVKVSELKAYREKRIESEKILFPDMVSGESREEIEASIELLKSKESDVRTQLEDKLRQELKQNIPRPVSPNAFETGHNSARDRYELSKVSKKDYKALRAKMMSSALDSSR